MGNGDPVVTSCFQPWPNGRHGSRLSGDGERDTMVWGRLDGMVRPISRISDHVGQGRYSLVPDLKHGAQVQHGTAVCIDGLMKLRT